MKGNDLITLLKFYGKGNGEGKLSPFFEQEEKKFECYIGYNTGWIDVNVYDGDKLATECEIDLQKSEQAGRFIFFKELSKNSLKPKWFENKPQNMLFDYVRSNEDRDRLITALEKDIPIYYTFNSRTMPFFENAVITDNVKFIISPDDNQMQWFDNKVDSLDEELCFTQEHVEKAVFLPHEKLISLLKSRLMQYDIEEAIRWIKLCYKAEKVITEPEKDLIKNDGPDMEL